MRKYGVALVGIIVVCLGMADASLASQASDPRVESPAGWVYGWTVRPDSSTQIWRRPTTDSSATWLPAGTIPQEVIEIATTRAQPAEAVARTNQTLFYTTDAGGNWREMAGLPDWPTSLALGQQTPGLIYLGTLSGGVYRSLDGGQSWQHLPSELEMFSGTFLEVTALAIHPSDDDYVYLAAGHWLGSSDMQFTPSGIALSLDGGEDWLPIHHSGLNDPRITQLNPDPKRPLHVLAEAGGSARWYSLDSTVLSNSNFTQPNSTGTPTKADGWELFFGLQ